MHKTLFVQKIYLKKNPSILFWKPVKLLMKFTTSIQISGGNYAKAVSSSQCGVNVKKKIIMIWVILILCFMPIQELIWCIMVFRVVWFLRPMRWKTKINCFQIPMASASDEISVATDAQFEHVKSCHGFVLYFRRIGRIALRLSHLTDLHWKRPKYSNTVR